MFRPLLAPTLAFSVLARPLTAGAATAPEAAEFFEQKIRPVLVTECYECHGAKKQKGGLRLDSRAGWQKGGDSGDVIHPGDVKNSLLLQTLRHEDADLKMPEKAPKLDDAVIADFEKWVALGAPDPRDAPPSGDGTKAAWADLLASRKGWWSLQPVHKPVIPQVRDAAWSAHPVDRFLLAKMEAKGLAPAADAEPRVLVRRLTFGLTGLPPAPEEVDRFVRESIDDPQGAVAKLAGRLLASPHFGERFARHWLDLFRYAETHGSEGDPPIPQAWRFRDYVIRAFNADVPADQLIREHIAGDLLAEPRSNPSGFDESKIGPAHFRLVEHGFQPVDTLDEQVKTVDNQIDVVSKAFQALTISCARCHDHKFDAVSQRDYTALYGIFASCRPTQVTLDTPAALSKQREQLETLHARIKRALAEVWLDTARNFNPAGVDPKLLQDAEKNRANPLHLWAKLGALDDAALAVKWPQLTQQLRDEIAAAQRVNRERRVAGWDLGGADYAQWFPSGPGPGAKPGAAGEFAIEPEGERVITGVLPAGALTHRLTMKHGGTFTSPRFKIEHDSLSVRAFGGGEAMMRVICDHYPLQVNDTYPHRVLSKSEPGWMRFDTAYRKGAWAYVEFATRDDLTRPIRDAAAPKLGEGRSYFGASEVVIHHGKEPLRDAPLALQPLIEMTAPQTTRDLLAQYQEALTEAVMRWRDGSLSEPQRALLDFTLRRELLPVTLAKLEPLRPLVAEYRRIEHEIAVPQRAPGLLETRAYDAPFMPRGDHLQAGEPVPRGYLEVFGGGAFTGAQSGRMELADALADPRNPLTARVLVNRVWHWLFGRGIVPTVDNFGRLGEKPTHPELLDFLAARFVEERWSMKDLVRFLVTSRAYGLSSDAPARVAALDPTNELLAHFRVRRLEAESVRDAVLAVSGRLDRVMEGPPADGNAQRRGIYLAVKRTNLNPFLDVFDAPRPFTTLGCRDATNVPAQSLALLNSPFVAEEARAWAQRLCKAKDETPDARVRRMFAEAFARLPSDDELRTSASYLAALASDANISAEQLPAAEPVWQAFAHALFNLKEFIYLR